MPKLSEKGVIQFVILLILAVGLIAGVYLVQQTQIFKPKAAPTLPSAPEASFELELEKSGEPPFPDEATPTTIPIGSKFRVDIYARSDTEAANLFKASIHFTRDTDRISFIEPVEINRREGQSFVKNWVETASSGITFITMTGGVANPGIQTDAKSGALLMGSIVFEAKRVGKVKIELTDDSAIYSNANNINILTARKGAIEVQITDNQPSPTPTPIARNVSCTGVVAEGGVVSKLPNGDSVYILESDGKMKLTAQVNSTGTNTAVWIVVGRPTGYPSLPNNGGFFDYPGPGLIVNYTAPKNTTASIDNLAIQSTVTAVFSDGYTASTQCPLVMVSVKPAVQPTPSPTLTPSPTSSPSSSPTLSPTPTSIPSSTPSPQPSPSTLPPSSSYLRVFKTSDSVRTYDGNLIVEANSLSGEQVQINEGLKAADKICQYRAGSRNLGGTWKAWLSDSQTSAASRLIHASVPYKRLDGVTIANNWSDLTDGSLQATINVTEFGVKTLDAGAWTNTLPNGERKYTQTSNTCDNWRTSQGCQIIDGKQHCPYNGSQGYDFNTNSGWTDATTLACSYSDSLYCFEQTSGAPSVTPLSSTGDGNSDGKVDLADLSILLTDFNKSGGIRTGIDLNGDGVINTFDFSLMKDLLIQKGVIKG